MTKLYFKSGKKMSDLIRSEEEVFRDLEKLCISPGYAHAIAIFNFRDNVISYSEKGVVDEMVRQYTSKRIIRTEFSILVGLMCKADIDISLPPCDVLQRYIDDTERLLEELHQSMAVALYKIFDPERIVEKDFNPFRSGNVLREAIFYGADSAFSFQYRELLFKKFGEDNEWFLSNKGFSIKDAAHVLDTIEKLQSKKISFFQFELIEKPPRNWTVLPGMTFTLSDVLAESELEQTKVEAVIRSFCLPDGARNEAFTSISEFNRVNECPIIPLSDNKYLLFFGYALGEALYETPFYWLNADKAYSSIAMRHRGEFTEKFSAERLELVFGCDNVFTNINIVDSKKSRAGEIDVLVVFSDRAIVLQAKSKKLTLAARKGNDKCIKNDFKKSVQDSYDQGLLCAQLLTDEEFKLVDAHSKDIGILRDLKKIYIFCVVSDHYPALTFQTQQFLKFEKTEVIQNPFVMDVFFLDVMTEMLQTPLPFLSYVDQRTEFYEKLVVSSELASLSFYLKNNLWTADADPFCVSDDICSEVTAAMMVRRNGAPGDDTPAGILTWIKGTFIARLIGEIECLEKPEVIDLGLLLLKLNEELIKRLNSKIEAVISLARRDSKPHDLSFSVSQVNFGLTIHFTDEPIETAQRSLQSHCDTRKYLEKTKTWFGLIVGPESFSIRFSIVLDFDWEYSAQRSEHLNSFLAKSKNKIGRNVSLWQR